MSIVGTYRLSGVTAASGTCSDRVINIAGFRPSGLPNGNLLAVALYVYSGNAMIGDGYWMPLQNDFLS